MILTITGPSGVGKTSLERFMCTEHGPFHRVVSHTTREPREGERDGVDYHFITKQKFILMNVDSEFAEVATPHGAWYGATVAQFTEPVDQGLIPFFICDPEGVVQLKAEFGNRRVVSVFMLPPDWDEVEKRIRSRSVLSEEQIERRMQDGKEWVLWAHTQGFIDYMVNQKPQIGSRDEQLIRSLNQTSSDVLEIVKCELKRPWRSIQMEETAKLL